MWNVFQQFNYVNEFRQTLADFLKEFEDVDVKTRSLSRWPICTSICTVYTVQDTNSRVINWWIVHEFVYAYIELIFFSMDQIIVFVPKQSHFCCKDVV